MTYTSSDRDELCEIGSRVTAVMADIAHHEMGDITEGWSVYDDVPSEITRLRDRLNQLQEAIESSQRNLRALEIRGKVRQVWQEAFAAGQVDAVEDDDEFQLMYDLVTVHGVAEMLLQAEMVASENPSLERDQRQQIRDSQALGNIEDQLLERILKAEGASEEDMPDDQDAFFEDPRWQRAERIVDVFVAAVYGPPATEQEAK